MTQYLCSVCNATHGTPEAAQVCEARPVIHDIGAIPGATVRILRGYGTGELATVAERMVDDTDHGVAVVAQFKIPPCSYRYLEYGDYEMA